MHDELQLQFFFFFWVLIVHTAQAEMLDRESE